MESAAWMAGIIWAESAPAGPFTPSAAFQSDASNPGWSQPGVSPRANRAFRKLEFGAKLVGAGNPLRFPLLAMEQPHVEPRRLAVLARVALLVPVAHLPVIGAAAFERLAGVRDLRGLVGPDLAAVPLVAPVLIERVAARRDEHPVGGLRLAALEVFEHPGESWLRDVDAERVREILASEVSGRRRAVLGVGELDRPGRSGQQNQ